MSLNLDTTPSTSKLAHVESRSSEAASSNSDPASVQQPTATGAARSKGKGRKGTGPDPDSLRYVLTSGLAGGIAGCVAKTSVAPLDRVKILFQTRSPEYQRYAGTWLGVFRASKDIYAESGVRGLLQGHSATILRIFPYAAIKFMAYERFHNILMPTPEAETSGRRFVAGSLAGVTSALITYPLELIRVRLAFEPHHSKTDRSSLLRTIRQIYLEPPLPLLKPTKSTSSTPISSTSLPPRPVPIAPQSASIPYTIKPSLTHFYRGVMPTIVGIVPYAGTSFLIWGFLKHDLIPSYLSPGFRSRHHAALDLVAGGLAGAIGQTAAYPLDIVRRRMQVGPVLQPGRRMGFWETARGVYAIGGWRAFFVGLSIGYLKVVPMNAVSFASWVALKGVFGLDGESR